MDVVTDNALPVLRELLVETMEELAVYVIDGRCKNYDGYRYLVGKIEGLRLAEDNLVELQRKIEES